MGVVVVVVAVVAVVVFAAVVVAAVVVVVVVVVVAVAFRVRSAGATSAPVPLSIPHLSVGVEVSDYASLHFSCSARFLYMHVATEGRSRSMSRTRRVSGSSCFHAWDVFRTSAGSFLCVLLILASMKELQKW